MKNLFLFSLLNSFGNVLQIGNLRQIVGEHYTCPADRILGNQSIMQLLSLKLETEGEEATVTFLESLGCSDVDKVMQWLSAAV